MIFTFSSPLTDDGCDQGPVLVVVHAGVAGGPREALHLVWHTRPPGTGLWSSVSGSDGERAGRGAVSLLQPALVPPEVRPELVQPVPVLCQLALRSFVWIQDCRGHHHHHLYWHGVPQRRVGLVHRLHLHQSVTSGGLLKITQSEHSETRYNAHGHSRHTWDIFPVNSSILACSFFLRWLGGSSEKSSWETGDIPVTFWKMMKWSISNK